MERETVEEALENDRCGKCGSVDHFVEDHPKEEPCLYPSSAPVSGVTSRSAPGSGTTVGF